MPGIRALNHPNHEEESTNVTKTNGSATRAGMVALVTVLGARVVRQYPTPEDDADDE